MQLVEPASVSVVWTKTARESCCVFFFLMHCRVLFLYDSIEALGMACWCTLWLKGLGSGAGVLESVLEIHMYILVGVGYGTEIPISLQLIES